MAITRQQLRWGGARHITVIDGIDVMGEREGDA